MSTYEELKKKFEEKVKLLQERCQHKDVSDWMEEQWAPAHTTGYMVRICNTCYKQVDKKSAHRINLSSVKSP